MTGFGIGMGRSMQAVCFSLMRRSQSFVKFDVMRFACAANAFALQARSHRTTLNEFWLF